MGGGPNKRKKKGRKGKRTTDPTGTSGTDLCPVYWKLSDIPIQDEYKYRWCNKKCGRICHWRHMKPYNETCFKSKEAEARAGTAAEKDDVKMGNQYGDFMYAMCVWRAGNALYTFIL